jgi:nitroreductase
LEAIRARRTVRAFADAPVPEAVMAEILDAARWAPTSGNAQPWAFIRVRTPERRAALIASTYGGYARSAPAQGWLAQAPELVMACVAPLRTIARYGQEGRSYARLDVAAAIQNMLIAATALDVGAAWIGGFRPEEARSALELEPALEPLGIVAFGRPAEAPERPYRLPLADVVREV